MRYLKRTTGLSIIFGVVTSCIVFLSPGRVAAATNEEQCNQDIAKIVVKLQRAYASRFGACVRSDLYLGCPDTGDAIKRQEKQLRQKVSGAKSHCALAVEGDGVPVSSFGPVSCPAAWNECDTTVPTIDTLDDLADCLVCVNRGIALHYRFLLDLPEPTLLVRSDQKCLRAVEKAARKAFVTGIKEIARCGRGGVKPFSCPVSDDPNETKFGRALAKITRKVFRCTDESGVRGAIGRGVGLMCHRAVVSPQDLDQCLAETSRCLACQTSNAMLGQSQDCPAFSGLRNCAGLPPVKAGRFYVVNEADDSVTFFVPVGGSDADYVNGSLPDSSFVTGQTPVDVAVDAFTRTVYVANRTSGTVTYLDGATGDYAYGDLVNSSFAVGTDPVAIAAAAEEGILYVVNQGDDSVTLLDAQDGSYVYDTPAESTVLVGSQPAAIAIREDLGIVYVANYGDDSVTYLDAATGGYLYGTLGASSFPAGDGPSGVAVKEGGGLKPLAVSNELDDSVTFLDSVTGVPLLGTVPASSLPAGDGPGPIISIRSEFCVANANDNTVTALTGSSQTVPKSLPAGNQPSDLAASKTPGRFYVTAQGDNAVGVCSADDPVLDSGIPFPRGKEIAVNVSAGLLYVLNDLGVTYLDRASSDYLNGTLTKSSFSVGPQPSGLALNESAGIVYGGSADDGTVTFLDARTGAYLNGTFANSTFAVGGLPIALAVNESAGILYVLTGGGVTFLNATTGAYWNGSLSNSTFSVGDGPQQLAVNSSAGLIYVATLFGVTYLDAITGAYANGNYVNSTVSIDDVPSDVAVNETSGVVFVSTRSGMVYLDANTVGYLNGSLADSSLAKAGQGWSAAAVTVNESAGVAYAASDMGVTYLDAATGDYLYGTFRDSTFDVRWERKSTVADIVADESSGIVYVMGITLLFPYPTMMMTRLDAVTGAYVSSALGLTERDLSVVEVPWNGQLARGMVVNDTTGVLYAATSEGVFSYNYNDDPSAVNPGQMLPCNAAHEFESVAVGASTNIVYATSGLLYLLDATSGACIGEKSAGPYAGPVVVNESAGLVYVATADGLTYLDATTGDYLNSSRADSSLPFTHRPGFVATSESLGIVYVTDALDGTVTYADATALRYWNGTLPDSTFPVGNYPVAIAVNESLGIVYVVNKDDHTVTYLDAATGGYWNGTLANSTFLVGDSPVAVAVNESAGIVYVANEGDGTVTFLDAAGGGYTGGTLENSSVATFGWWSPMLLAVDEAAGILYVGDGRFQTIVLLDAATGMPRRSPQLCLNWLATGSLPAAVAVMPSIR